jgi:hypothetical protein
VVVAGGLVLYGLEIRAILRGRKRRRLDWGLRTFLVAISLLVPTVVLGLVLGWPGLPATALTTQLETVYALLALLGTLALSILGLLHKIVPFLVWYHAYSGKVGRQKVPTFADLYSEPVQKAGLALFLAGFAVTGVSTALGHAGGVRAGAALLLAALLATVVNLALMIRHLFAPRTEPLAGIPTAAAPPKGPHATT